MRYRIKKINIGGVVWEYIVSGRGNETFLILPGGGQTAQLNFKLIQELEKNYKVIAVNIYNCDSLDQFCSALNKILSKEKAAGNLIIHGLSLGGLLAQSYLLRNRKKVKSLIISHACTPKSKTYFRKIVAPLSLLNIVLPVLPNQLIKFVTRYINAPIQKAPKTYYSDPFFTEKDRELNRQLSKEFYDKYLNKRLLKTWINLNREFYKYEKITLGKLKDWKGDVLILRTDNDPLMQDEGDFKEVYPQAKVHTFKNTGHLTFYYQFNEMVKKIKKFINF